ncbi:MAG: 16S rRNA (guanine(527)-N(7))-methyltransferase RsmG [Bacteroidetes bacterium]|nr:MAG: 16S rRNA (guanine(527)-N(7))-methyltransferase RsmG [Bacteroidota bacterium]
MSIQIISKYFPLLSDAQKKQFAALGELYNEWNEKINVISRKDIENLYINHVLHALAISKVQPFNVGSHILDVGTGGGFPGVPLAILFPEVRFHLVDSIAKKITVVKEVSAAIGLKNVVAEQERVENLDAKYDFIVTRGVTTLQNLYNWTHKSIKKESKHELSNGILALKGGDSLIEEITEMSKHHVKTWLISEFFNEDFFETKKVVYLKM